MIFLDDLKFSSGYNLVGLNVSHEIMNILPPQLQQHFWSPIPSVIKYCEKIAGEFGLNILEIGPGHIPFALANTFVDWQAWDNLKNKRVITLDINSEHLPFKDKEFDFVYCRHTIEDLSNPMLIIGEMARVARAGYIETPSPIAECARGTDGGNAPWRGYHHHRYIVWTEGNQLHLVPKYPLIEHIDFDEHNLIAILSSSAFFWNTVYFWTDKMQVHLHKHDIDFKITTDYSALLLQALKSSHKAATEFAAKIKNG